MSRSWHLDGRIIRFLGAFQPGKAEVGVTAEAYVSLASIFLKSSTKNTGLSAECTIDRI